MPAVRFDRHAVRKIPSAVIIPEIEGGLDEFVIRLARVASAAGEAVTQGDGDVDGRAVDGAGHGFTRGSPGSPGDTGGHDVNNYVRIDEVREFAHSLA